MEQLIMDIQTLQEINKSLMDMLKIISGLSFGTYVSTLIILFFMFAAYRGRK